MKSIQKIKILLLLLSPITPTIALYNNTSKNHTLYIHTPSLSPSPPPPEMTPLKPSMAVIVAVLTTMFSITFLLLLYAKHCKRSNNNGNNDLSELYSLGGVPPKNSGVDRTIIESLPVFRFGALVGEKDGLECAVCLGRFEQTEVLRLLPKCKHAFHVECVDTWLEAHSTCPLCRYRVEPEDILLLASSRESNAEGADRHRQSVGVCPPPPPYVRRVSGRHSSAGERGSNRLGIQSQSVVSPLQIVIDPPGRRRSYDGGRHKGGGGGERKDGALLLPEGSERSDRRKKLDHRIVIGGSDMKMEQRWSDVQPSDLLFLRSEMIMGENRSRPSNNSNNNNNNSTNNCNGENESGKRVINGRSVSEITGLNRFEKTTSLSRWMAWVPHRQSVVIDTSIHIHQLPAVR